MKFACERCQTRYSISDEKVQGKVLKIRCKTCGNIIVLREQGAETAAQQAQAGAAAAGARGPAPRTEVDFARPAAGPSTASRNDVDWFVAVKGKQHGPLKRDDVIRMLREGSIHDRSYCWNEDLPGWTRLRELPEFANVAAGAPAMPPPPPSDDDQRGQVVSLEAHRQARGGTPPGAVTHDPFAAVTGGVPGASAQNESSAPRESTRVFIMNAGLHNRSQKHKTYAIAAVAVVVGFVGLGYADYAGYVQIPLLHGVVNYTLEATGAEAPRKRQLLAKFTSDEEMDPELECRLLGNCARLEEQKKRSGGRRANPTGGGLDDLNLDDAFGNIGGATGRADIGPDGKPIDIAGSDANLAKDIREQLGSGMGKPMVGPNLKKVDVNDSIAIATNNNVDMTQVAKVVKQNINSVKPCVETAAKNAQSVPGKQKLLVLIRANGVVGAAKLGDPVVNASALGECVVRAVKKWKFAPTGTEYEVELPLILSTS